MHDMTLRQDILDELEFEPSIDASNIGVTVTDSIVTLSGHVGSYAQKAIVEDVVGRVKGIRGIAEEIEVRLPGAVGTSDDEIVSRALNTLTWSTLIPAGKVQVKVEKGWLTLTGTLEWSYQKTGAADAVRHLAGVVGVSNLIELRPRLSPVDVKHKIEGALRRSAAIEADAIQVKVAGNRVTLEGNVRAWHERRVAEQAAWSTPGVTAVEDHLTVS